MAEPEVFRVGVFQHHGELVNLENPEFGLFFRILENQRVDCCAVSSGDREWAEFDALLIGVPTSKMPAEEIHAINRFIGRNGRVLVLVSFGGDTAPHGNSEWESNIEELDPRLVIDDILVIDQLTDGGFAPVAEFETDSSVEPWRETYHYAYGTGLEVDSRSDQVCFFLPEMRMKDGRLVRPSSERGNLASEEFFSTRQTLHDSRLIIFGAAYSFSDEWLGEIGNIQLLNELLADWNPRQIKTDCERRMAEPQRHRLLHGYPMAPMMAAVDTGHDEVFAPSQERKMIVGVLPHPFCNPKLTGCGFCVFPHESFQASLAREAVRDTITEIRQAAEMAPKLWGRRKVGALYFGGGTANLTPVEEFRELCTTLVDCFDLEDAEISLEGVPIYFLAKKQALLDVLQETMPSARLRISMGVQTFDPQQIERMGRRAFGSREDIANLIKQAHRRKILVSGDFLFNLPHQSRAGMLEDIRVADGMGFDQICLYHLVMFDGLGTAWSEDKALLEGLPTNELACENWLALRDRMLSKFDQRSLTNFERRMPWYRKRRPFLYEEYGFRPEVWDTHGFGSSGISLFCDWTEMRGVKHFNHTSSVGYHEAVRKSGAGHSSSFEFGRLDMQILYLTRAVARLGFDLEEYRKLFGTDTDSIFDREMEALEQSGLIRFEDDERGQRMVTTPKGMFYGDTIAGLLASRRVNHFRLREIAHKHVSSAPYSDPLKLDFEIDVATSYAMG